MIVHYLKGGNCPLTLNFHSGEFDCKCGYQECNVTYIDLDLIYKLQEKRNLWQQPIHINSGFRCARHNHEVGGKDGSYHMIGKAADIRVDGMTADAIADQCEDFNGLGRYDTFTHVDVRGNKSRWDLRKPLK